MRKNKKTLYNYLTLDCLILGKKTVNIIIPTYCNKKSAQSSKQNDPLMTHVEFYFRFENNSPGAQQFKWLKAVKLALVHSYLRVDVC